MISDDFGAGGVDLEISFVRDPATLIADIGGLAIAAQYDTVGRVADADLRSLNGRRGGEIDFCERVVLIQERIGAFAILGDGQTTGVGSFRSRRD